MQSSLQKKDEIDLWEFSEPKKQRQRQPGNRARAEYQAKMPDFRKRSAAQPRSDRQNKSIQIIGQDEAKQSKRRSRSVQIIGQPEDEYERLAQRRRAVEPDREMPRRRVAEADREMGRRRAAEPDREMQRRRMEETDREMRHRRAAEPDREMQRRRVAETDREMRRRRAAQSDRELQRRQSAQALKRRKARKRRAVMNRLLTVFMIIGCLGLAAALTSMVYETVHEWKEQEVLPVVNLPVEDEPEQTGMAPPAISQDFLEINDYSRPGTPLKEVNSIFVHYTANPGTSARQNRSYFANLAQTQERSASAHYIIGYEGEIVQCIPLDEQAYAVMTRNEDSISIECCYLEEDGAFTQETYDSLVHILAWLLQKYNLESDDILRHYDCGGKRCPLYYVEHEDAWGRLLSDVKAYQEKAGGAK